MLGGRNPILFSDCYPDVVFDGLRGMCLGILASPRRIDVSRSFEDQSLQLRTAYQSLIAPGL